MPNGAIIKNIYVYLQTNNYTMRFYFIYRQRDPTNDKGNKTRERERKGEGKGYKDVNLFNLY